MDFSLQILGGSWRIFPGGIIVGPPDKSAELFLPSLSHPQVQLPGLVHGPGGVERERRHLQQCEYEGQRRQRVSRLFKTCPLKILFPLFQQHHKEIEDQAEMAKKTVMEKLGLHFKKEKGDKDKGEKVTKSLFKKMESTDKKES